MFVRKFVRKNEDETTSGVESGSLTESAADPLAGADQHDEQTAEQTAVESDATVDANTDGLSDETDSETTGQTEAVGEATDDEIDSSTDSFSRTYVEKLRRENAGYRERAQRADELAARLHTALVSATGRLADPTDLPFDAAHLDDSDVLSAAIDELLTRKPHLATRRPFGDVGQGNRGGISEPVNLADMLRARA